MEEISQRNSRNLINLSPSFNSLRARLPTLTSYRSDNNRCSKRVRSSSISFGIWWISHEYFRLQSDYNLVFTYHQTDRNNKIRLRIRFHSTVDSFFQEGKRSRKCYARVCSLSITQLRGGWVKGLLFQVNFSSLFFENRSFSVIG